jgi:hypothetical protein
MKRYLVALGLALAAFTACAVDPAAAPDPDETAQTAADETTASQAVEVPDALRPITNATCASQSGTGCLTPFLCRANNGSQVPGTGCTGKNICCHFP